MDHGRAFLFNERTNLMSEEGQPQQKRWDKKKYLAKRAEQVEALKPEWITNPETGNTFFLKRVGSMAYAIAGAMPHALTNEALKNWRAEGIGVDQEDAPKRLNAKLIEEGNRSVELIAKVVTRACVIPKLVPGYTGDDDDTIDPIDLDDRDALFIFRYGTHQTNGIRLKGGEEVKREDLQNFSEQPVVSAGVGTDGPELLPATQ